MVYRFKVPATSANLGVCFDAAGIAFDLYVKFTVEPSDKWDIKGFSEEFKGEDSYFTVGYLKALDYKGIPHDCVKATIDSDVPMTGGLGSSSALYVGGIYAASIMHGNFLSRNEMLEIATDLEGHPDNVTPAIFGGLCIAHGNRTLRIDVDERWRFGAWTRNTLVSTIEARKILPSNYTRSETVCNVSAAILVIDALKNFNVENIDCVMDDRIHEPYRKTLIPFFDETKDYVLKAGARAFIISGSGSTCLSICDRDIELEGRNGFTYIPLTVNKEGIIDGE